MTCIAGNCFEQTTPRGLNENQFDQFKNKAEAFLTKRQSRTTRRQWPNPAGIFAKFENKEKDIPQIVATVEICDKSPQSCEGKP